MSQKLEKFYPNAATRWVDFLKSVEAKTIVGATEEAKFDLYVKTAVCLFYLQYNLIFIDPLQNGNRYIKELLRK